MSAEWHKVANAEDVPAGGALQVSVGNELIAVYNLDGRFYATSDVCTHRFALLTDGYIEGDTVECPLHQAVFHIPTGKATVRAGARGFEDLLGGTERRVHLYRSVTEVVMSDLRMKFDTAEARFVDRTAAAPEANQFWAPVVIGRERIDAEVERLANLPNPADGRRQSLIVHPLAPEAAPGLAPGIRVTLSVLKPGERTRPFRHNATEVNFCIAGSGHTVVGGKRIAFRAIRRLEPSVVHGVSPRQRQRRTAGAAHVFEHAAAANMQVHLVDDDPPPEAPPRRKEDADARRRGESPYGTFRSATTAR